MPADYTPVPEAEIRGLLKLFDNHLQNASTYAKYRDAAFARAPRFALELLGRRKAIEEAPHESNCHALWKLDTFGSRHKRLTVPDESCCNCWKSKFTKERTNG
jgi:hypothetical protein